MIYSLFFITRDKEKYQIRVQFKNVKTKANCECWLTIYSIRINLWVILGTVLEREQAHISLIIGDKIVSYQRRKRSIEISYMEKIKEMQLREVYFSARVSEMVLGRTSWAWLITSGAYTLKNITAKNYDTATWPNCHITSVIR